MLRLLPHPNWPMLRTAAYSGAPGTPMKKLHIAISTDDIEKTVDDYRLRLGEEPCSYVPGQYALWRTANLNFSVRRDPTTRPGELRHLGWEDPAAREFSEERDSNGITWERFNSSHQADEINAAWPDARYTPKD